MQFTFARAHRRCKHCECLVWLTRRLVKWIYQHEFCFVFNGKPLSEQLKIVVKQLQNLAGLSLCNLHYKTLWFLDIEGCNKYMRNTGWYLNNVVACAHLLPFLVKHNPILIEDGRLVVYYGFRLSQFTTIMRCWLEFLILAVNTIVSEVLRTICCCKLLGTHTWRLKACCLHRASKRFIRCLVTVL